MDEDEDDVKAELLSLCDDDNDEISLEHKCKKNTTVRKSPRKQQQTQHNGTGMKLRNCTYLKSNYKQ